MLDLPYVKDGEKANAENFNRVILALQRFFARFPNGTVFLSHADMGNATNLDDPEMLLTKESIDALENFNYQGSQYVGKLDLRPFRNSELQKGWIPCDGTEYPLYTDVGKALDSLSSAYKSLYGIKKSTNSSFVDVISAPKFENGLFTIELVSSQSFLKSGTGSVYKMTPCIYIGSSAVYDTPKDAKLVGVTTTKLSTVGGNISNIRLDVNTLGIKTNNVVGTYRIDNNEEVPFEINRSDVNDIRNGFGQIVVDGLEPHDVEINVVVGLDKDDIEESKAITYSIPSGVTQNVEHILPLPEELEIETKVETFKFVGEVKPFEVIVKTGNAKFAKINISNFSEKELRINDETINYSSENQDIIVAINDSSEIVIIGGLSYSDYGDGNDIDINIELNTDISLIETNLDCVLSSVKLNVSESSVLEFYRTDFDVPDVIKEVEIQTDSKNTRLFHVDNLLSTSIINFDTGNNFVTTIDSTKDENFVRTESKKFAIFTKEETPLKVYYGIPAEILDDTEYKLSTYENIEYESYPIIRNDIDFSATFEAELVRESSEVCILLNGFEGLKEPYLIIDNTRYDFVQLSESVWNIKSLKLNKGTNYFDIKNLTLSKDFDFDVDSFIEFKFRDYKFDVFNDNENLKRFEYKCDNYTVQNYWANDHIIKETMIIDDNTDECDFISKFTVENKLPVGVPVMIRVKNALINRQSCVMVDDTKYDFIYEEEDNYYFVVFDSKGKQNITLETKVYDELSRGSIEVKIDTYFGNIGSNFVHEYKTEFNLMDESLIISNIDAKPSYVANLSINTDLDVDTKNRYVVIDNLDTDDNFNSYKLHNVAYVGFKENTNMNNLGTISNMFFNYGVSDLETSGLSKLNLPKMDNNNEITELYKFMENVHVNKISGTENINININQENVHSFISNSTFGDNLILGKLCSGNSLLTDVKVNGNIMVSFELSQYVNMRNLFNHVECNEVIINEILAASLIFIDMSYMFNKCKIKHITFPTNPDVFITDAECSFANNEDLISVTNFVKFNFERCLSLIGTFKETPSLLDIGDISLMYTKNVKFFDGMFRNSSLEVNVDLLDNSSASDFSTIF